jgi:hypothetical protein
MCNHERHKSHPDHLFNVIELEVQEEEEEEEEKEKEKEENVES